MGIQDVEFEYQLEVLNGLREIEYERLNGPEWLTLSPSGLISGTPTVESLSEPLNFRALDGERFQDFSLSIDIDFKPRVTNLVKSEGIDLNKPITLNFSEPIQLSLDGSILVYDEFQNEIEVFSEVFGSDLVLTFDGALLPNKKYFIDLASIQDINGLAVSVSDQSFEFTTRSFEVLSTPFDIEGEYCSRNGNLFLSSGVLVCVWNDLDYVIYSRQYLMETGTWSEVQELSDVGQRGAVPQIAAINEDTILVVWFDKQKTSGNNLYFNIYKKGVGWTAAALVPFGSQAYDPKLRANSLGQAIVTWSDGPTYKATYYDLVSGWANFSQSLYTFSEGNLFDSGLEINDFGKGVLIWSYRNNDHSDFGKQTYDLWHSSFEFSSGQITPDSYMLVDNIGISDNSAPHYLRRPVLKPNGDFSTLFNSNNNAENDNSLYSLDVVDGSVSIPLRLESDPINTSTGDLLSRQVSSDVACWTSRSRDSEGLYHLYCSKKHGGFGWMEPELIASSEYFINNTAYQISEGFEFVFFETEIEGIHHLNYISIDENSKISEPVELLSMEGRDYFELSSILAYESKYYAIVQVGRLNDDPSTMMIEFH